MPGSVRSIMLHPMGSQEQDLTKPHDVRDRITGEVDWRTKPTDRFVLKWIKLHLSAPITGVVYRWSFLRPWMLTITSSALGLIGGVLFALGHGWQAGLVAAGGQILDGVDGQVARRTNRASAGGAFWDSVLDRYADGALLIGMIIFVTQHEAPVPLGVRLALGALAVIGGNLISYTTARADSLDLDLGRPTLASKGTRTTVMILGAWGSALWCAVPFWVLVYLVLHTNLVVISRLARVRGVER